MTTVRIEPRLGLPTKQFGPSRFAFSGMGYLEFKSISQVLKRTRLQKQRYAQATVSKYRSAFIFLALRLYYRLKLSPASKNGPVEGTV